MKKSSSSKTFADLRHERDIAQLQQTIHSLTDELRLCRSQLDLSNAQIAYLNHTVEALKTDVAEWQRRYGELLDMSESMQRSLYVYEELTGTEEEVRVEAAIAELMQMTDRDGEPLVTMGRQWWGIYRILVDYLGYPAGYTQFFKHIKARGMDKARVPLKLSSLKAISGTIFERPFEQWTANRHKVASDATFNRHYDVASMMRKLVEES